LTLLGILLGFWFFRDAYPVVFGTPIDFLACLGLLFSVFFAYQSAVAVNDIVDIEADKISNNSRPLVKKKLSSGDVKMLAVIYMLIAFLFAINVKYSCFFLVLVSITLSLVYSLPPLKLKRFFPVSTFILALAALVTILMGFSIFGSGKSVYIFPKSLMLLVLVIFTLAGTIKDLKDFEGDKKTGIKTLPVLLGKHRGKIVTAFFVLLSYILIAPIIRMPILFIPAIVFGILSMFIILKKKRSEKPIFVLYFAFIIILAFFIQKNIDTLRTSRVRHQIDTVGHFLSGETYFKRGRYGQAINEYKKAILYSYKDERTRLQ
jgi:4-hydroxybenzoate polyprenyltransferase